MALVCGPVSLQQLSEAAAVSWLIQWSSLVSQVAAKVASTADDQSTSRDGNSKLGPVSTQREVNTKEIPLTFPGVSWRNVQTAPLENPVEKLRNVDLNHGDSITQVAVSECQNTQKGTCGHAVRTPHQRRKIFNRMERKRSLNPEYDSLTSSLNYSNTKEIMKYKHCISDVNASSNKALTCMCTEHSSQNTSRITESQKSGFLSSSSDSFSINSMNAIYSKNADNCSEFIRFHLPPLLRNQILNSSWKCLSQQVVMGARMESVPQYQVESWVRQAPVILCLISTLSTMKFPLNISGVPKDTLQNTLKLINELFPLANLNKVLLPKLKFKPDRRIRVDFQNDALKDILMKTALVSLSLHAEVCDDSILSLLSQLSLQELTISSNLVTECGVIQGLCGLPYSQASETVKALKTAELLTVSSVPLRKSLCKLDISLQNIPSVVYHLLLALFPGLTYYKPHIDMMRCIQSFASLPKPSKESFQNSDFTETLNLIKVNMRHATRNEILDLGRICPDLEELSLYIEEPFDDVLSALQMYTNITDLDLIYYPSLTSSPPKVEGRGLLPTIAHFKLKLQKLGLTGVNISKELLYELCQLPELKALKLSDCWLSLPENIPSQTFPSLETLSLQFLPPPSIMTLLTSSTNLVNLNLDFNDSEWGGNSLTDATIKYFVTSGMLRSLRSFTASSPLLTLSSLNDLMLLPCLKSVGHLARWGLTDDELHCVSHSSRPHLLYLH